MIDLEREKELGALGERIPPRTQSLARDLLYYFHRNSGASDERRVGVLIGCVTLLESHGFSS